VKKYDENDPYNPLYTPSQPYITPIILLSGPVLNANRQNWEWKKGIIVGIWCSYSYFFIDFHEKTANLTPAGGLFLKKGVYRPPKVLIISMIIPIGDKYWLLMHEKTN
jgi:hypothetical protein